MVLASTTEQTATAAVRTSSRIAGSPVASVDHPRPRRAQTLTVPASTTEQTATAAVHTSSRIAGSRVASAEHLEARFAGVDMKRKACMGID